MLISAKQFNEALIKRFCIEMDKKDRGGIYALTQRMFAYNSNKIEGSTLTERQTMNLFDTGSVWGDEAFRAKDIEETNGHFLLFNYMIKTINEPLTEELIKEYHYYLKNNVFEDRANGYPVGEYKNRKNIVGNITTALPEDVPAAMGRLLEDYYKKSNYQIDDLTKFHVDFERIHPFQDGNGRTGRIILFKECVKNNILPFIILDKNKHKYYAGLQNVSEGNYLALTEFFEQGQKDYFELAKDFLFSCTSVNKMSAPELER